MGFLKTAFAVVTGNPYVALAAFLALASVGGGAWWYVHNLHAQIEAAKTRGDDAIRDNGVLSTQKSLLLADSADKDSQILYLKAKWAASQAAADAARVDKDALSETLEKVLTDARNAPPAADGPVADVLGNALVGLCKSRPSSGAAGRCGLQDSGGIRPH